MAQCTIETAIGTFRITERDEVIVRLTWGSGDRDDSPLLREAARQLKAYAAGELQAFELNPEGCRSDLLAGAKTEEPFENNLQHLLVRFAVLANSCVARGCDSGGCFR